jgi:hypothetical protein
MSAHIMRVLVATHGHCFDGLCSAAIFTALMRQLHGGTADGGKLSFDYRSCGYGVGQPTASESALNGDVNAILDYRFTSSDRLHWYFDHHRTAFGSEADRVYFESRAAQDPRFVYDADFSSCTKLIYEHARREFGMQTSFDELVEWADRIDSASFDSAEAAVSKSDPIMQLVSVVEHHGNHAFLKRWVPELLRRPLREIATSREIQDRYAPIGDRHKRFVSEVRTKAITRGRVVYVDLTDKPLELIGKFVTYALFPESVYSVVVARLRQGFKISVGYNPWSGQHLDTDISAICARYGGGGHPVVGGISVADGRVDRARQIATSIANELDA